MTNANPPLALPALRDPRALVDAMAKVHRALVKDLLERSSDPRIEPSIREAHARDVAEKRTGEGYESYRDAFADQVAASWVLCAVFVRTLEDRGFLPHRLAGPGASDRFAQFRAQFKFLGERDYVLHVFDAVALLPGCVEVFGPGYAPLWKLGPSSRALGELLEALRSSDAEGLRFTFGRDEDGALGEHDGASTRYLGDLYQDLNEGVRTRFALLQTPEFVERFILEQTLDPAIRERGIAVTVIDPACGSGHFLLGAYDRLFDARREREPGTPVEESARTALAQVHGIDLNPYAAAIARFRLLLSYLDKASIRRLEQMPRSLGFHVYVGDALLAGLAEQQATFGDHLAEEGKAAGSFERGLFSFFDEAADKLLKDTRFDVVVANPPYITEKDAVKRDEIRKRYNAAAGKYALSAPFAERIFQLANEGGFTGQITSNSFMKREFGKALIEKVLRQYDLTEVLDATWADIPGHTTPTVLLFGRAQAPIGSSVRVTMGKRGELTTPAVKAEGKVWSSIVNHHTEVGYENEFVSIADVARAKLAEHPWSLGGGGAAELKELLEEKATKRLREVAESIGISSFTLEDDVYMASRHAHSIRGLRDSALRDMVEGDVIRDWAVAEPASVVFPYDDSFNPRLTDAQRRYLWPWKTNLANNLLFGSKTKVEGGLNWYEFGRLTAGKLRTPFTIAFAFVATHNHFVLDRGGKVFKQSAPIIKLPEGATEEEHLALLGYLNSSTGCFWMKQIFYPKATSVGDISVEKGKAENNRYEFAGTGLGGLPLVPDSMLPWARHLDSLGAKRSALSILASINDESRGDSLSEQLDVLERAHELFTGQMVAAQEELDWATYAAFGLCDSSLGGVDVSDVPGIRADQRPFGWVSGPPDDLPASLRERYVARRRWIEADPQVRQLETAVHKRPWWGMQGVFGHNTSSIRERQVGCLSDWLLDRTEEEIHRGGGHRPLSVRALASSLQADPKVRAVAEVLTGTATFDLEAVLGELIERESVTSATCQRYTDVGIENRRAWERTWELQRLEDAGEHPTIPKPEKYDQKDFENAGVVWRHRGKLDVPKERFIAYPTATPPSGASGKAGLVFGWAGWNHLEQLQAAIELWQEEMGLHGHELIPRATRKDREESLGGSAATDEGLTLDRAARDRLMPLLQTMVDLLPWVRQWHDEDGETASSFEAYVAAEARKLEMSLEEAHLYRRPKKVAAAKKTSSEPKKRRKKGEGV